MSHFISEKYKQTLTLKRAIYGEIQRKERHHFALSVAKFAVDDVIVLQSEDDELLNAKHQASAKNTWVVITTKEVFAMGEKLLCVYGFISLEDLPPKFLDIANNIYQANISLQESNLKMIQAGVEML
jgi:hypothetical protein